ncbi:MAG: glycosyltransferase family 4 protein [Campylobacterota bacterium]
MSMVFVCDHLFLTKNGEVYSNTFSYTVFKRYIDIFSKITVVARRSESDNVRGLPLASGEGIEFVFLENISTFSSFLGLRKKYRKVLKNIIREHDAVTVRVPSELGLLAASVARENKVKCLVEVVGCGWDAMWNYGGWKSKIYAPFLFMKMKNAVKRSAYVSYVTERFLQERYLPSKKARTISVSDVVLSDVDENTLSHRIKKIKNMEGKIVFGTIASLNVKYKGIDIALKALSEMTNRYDDFEYRVLGEGDPTTYKTLADKLGIGDKVFFDGVFPRGEAVLDWLDSIDIYLQPSLVEGLPRSLVEAMSRGCPAVGSSVGGIPELLDEDMTFSHKHPQEFSKILEDLLADKQMMIQIARNNFERAKKYQKSILDEKRNKFWIDFRDAT